MRNHSVLLWVLLVVDVVFGTAEVKSVLVMVGDTLTLKTKDTETQGAEELEWRIKGEETIIAQIDTENRKISVPGNEEEPFRGRLKMDEKTGSLTITNIRSTDSRVYELKIKSKNETKCYTFDVAVHDEVQSISVKEGDSATLHTGLTEIQRHDLIKWMFGDILIDELNGSVKVRVKNINMNRQTGDLTIKNIQNDQSGVYKMEINTSIIILNRKLHIAVDKVEPISLMEGYSVTLHTDVKVQKNDKIQWKFGDHDIPIASLNGPVDRDWRNIHLNSQTGNLTIRNIRSDQSGVYKVEVNTGIMSLHREFSISVEPLSVMKGDSVTLYTDFTEVQGDDQIVWKFGDQGELIPTLNGAVDSRWSVDLNDQTGDLTIRNIRSDQSGIYEVGIKKANGSMILQRKFHIDVSVPGLSLAAVAGIVVAIVLLMTVAAVAGVIYHRRKTAKLQSRGNAHADKGTGSDSLLKNKSENNSNS